MNTYLNKLKEGDNQKRLENLRKAIIDWENLPWYKKILVPRPRLGDKGCSTFSDDGFSI